MRELTLSKEIEINDDTYRVRKMNALDGMVLYKFVTEKALPVIMKLQASPEEEETETNNEQDGSGTLELIANTLASISTEETKSLLTDTLNFADVRLKSGWIKVMDGRRFSVRELEYDTMTCLQIAIQVIIFNFGDFFGENGLNLSLTGKNS